MTIIKGLVVLLLSLIYYPLIAPPMTLFIMFCIFIGAIEGRIGILFLPWAWPIMLLDNSYDIK